MSETIGQGGLHLTFKNAQRLKPFIINASVKSEFMVIIKNRTFGLFLTKF